MGKSAVVEPVPRGSQSVAAQLDEPLPIGDPPRPARLQAQDEGMARWEVLQAAVRGVPWERKLELCHEFVDESDELVGEEVFEFGMILAEGLYESEARVTAFEAFLERLEREHPAAALEERVYLETWRLERAIYRQCFDAEALRVFGEVAHEAPDTTFPLIDGLFYHGALPLLREVLPSIYTRSRQSDQLMPWALSELEHKLLELCEAQALAAGRRPQGEALSVELARHGVEVDAPSIETWLAHRHDAQVRAGVGLVREEDPWWREHAVASFVHDYLPQATGMPLMRQLLVQDAWLVLLTTHRPTERAAASQETKKKVTRPVAPAPVSSDLLPSVEALLETVSDLQPYGMAALVVTLPHWLDWLVSHGELDDDKVQAFWSMVGPTLVPITRGLVCWLTHDPVLQRELRAAVEA